MRIVDIPSSLRHVLLSYNVSVLFSATNRRPISGESTTVQEPCRDRMEWLHGSSAVVPHQQRNVVSSDYAATLWSSKYVTPCGGARSVYGNNQRCESTGLAFCRYKPIF